MEPQAQRPTGMKTFTIIWIGQILSLLGTAVGGFGLTLWAWEVSGKATALALAGFFFGLPMVALSPVVGVLVDRSNRKLMMMLSDLAAASATLVILILYLAGVLQIWHLYVANFVTGTFQAFQWPAYSAAISTMLDKKHYTRANSMLEMAGATSGVFAPMIAGALIGVIGLLGLLIIDLVSAAFAIGTLLFVHIPQPERSAAGEQASGSFWKEAVYGFGYIFQRPSLLGLQLTFMIGNLFASLAFAVYAPMILARTNNDEIIFGSVQSAAAIGGVVGGIVISAWGGFKRRVHGVLLGWAFSGIGLAALGMGQALPVWLVAAVASSFFSPLINGSNQAIWQAKVPPDIQGRVFSSRRLIAWLVMPASQLLAGPLVDRALEPAMQEGGALAPIFGRFVGVGPGAGIGLLFLICGVCATLTGLGGYLFPVVRNAEDLLPDHDAVSIETVRAEAAA